MPELVSVRAGHNHGGRTPSGWRDDGEDLDKKSPPALASQATKATISLEIIQHVAGGPSVTTEPLRESWLGDVDEPVAGPG